MYRLLIFFSFLLFYSCEGKRADRLNQQDMPIKEGATEKSFSIFEKDSAYIVNYQFNKKVAPNGLISYNYYNSKENFFIILCDTVNRTYKAISTQNDTATLYLEAERFYSVNSRDFKVIKLVGDKGVIDGEVSYFFDINTGLLLCKSNTWRIGKVLNPRRRESSYLPLTVLLYKVLTDDDFFNNPVPKSDIKFTPPKVE